MELFFSMFAAAFLAELGDKTQLFILGMATKYKIRDIVLGTVSAILLLNLIAVLAGNAVSSFIKPEIMKFISGTAFFAFAYTNFLFRNGPCGEEKERGIGKKLCPALTVGILFFLAEFGDKSQLLTVSFASSYGFSHFLSVFLACSLGLIIADVLAFVLSYFLGKAIPEKVLSVLSGFVFLAFGAFTYYEAFDLLMVNDVSRPIIFTVATLMAFAALCLFTFVIKMNLCGKNKDKKEG